MTRLRLASSRNRRGFTLIELLVVISIIAVLLSLIAPAVQNARRAARRMECSSNMHNVAVAAQSFAATNNGQLPALSSNMKVGTANTDLIVNWVVPLLPLMDQSALYRQIREVGAVPSTYIKVLTCPEDTNNFGKNDGLSYAANAGYISNKLWGLDAGTSNAGYLGVVPQHTLYTVNYDGDTTWVSVSSTGGPTTNAPDRGNTTANPTSDATYAVATGVFWRKININTPAVTIVDADSDPRVTLDSIGQGDGLTQTLMFAENTGSTSWSSARVDTCAFGVAVDEATPFQAGQLWVTGSSGWGYVVPQSFGQVPSTTWYSGRINSQPLTGPNAVGLPRPSSLHLGAVNVVFCDGSAKMINENIDNGVYLRLLSPDGKTYFQPLLDGNNY